MKMFDRKISVYNGVSDTIGKVCTLREFISNTTHAADIMRLRSLSSKEERNAIKCSLPLATISGTFAPTRKAENLLAHSGLICIDIDRKDNLHVENWGSVKQELSKLRQIAYVAVSVGGEGYFAILPLKYPEHHKAQFERLKRDFQDMGLKIDAACGDVCRLRCITYDPAPYINEDAEPYAGYYQEPKPVFVPVSTYDDTIGKVSKCCELIEQHHIDITGDYNEWRTVGMSLASLGEAGRAFFHICSQQSNKYKAAETDKKFNNLLHSTKRIAIGTFFAICQDYGIYFKSK